jgi:dTDP-6-deoxy-L-talose 4-dehydrogenase (NAD+)
MKNILLTGATGFLGKQIIKNLCKFNVNIIPVVRSGNEKFLIKNHKIKKIIYSPDIFKENENWWTETCKNIDTIIHTAWHVKPGDYLESPKNIDCLTGTLNLAKGAVNSSVSRFVGIGTCFEYDLTLGKLFYNTPLKPKTSYGSAKATLFTFLSHWLPKHSVNFAWCRLFYLYGEGENKNRLIPYIRERLDSNKQVELSKGNQIRDYLDIAVAGKIITEVSLGSQVGPINICSGIPITIKQIASNIANIQGKQHLLKFGSRPENPTDPAYVLGVPNYNIEN